MYVPVSKFTRTRPLETFTTVVVASFYCSYALHILMHCEQISLAELPNTFLTLACKSDISDALPSYLVLDMHCGGPVDSQEIPFFLLFLNSLPNKTSL